MVIHHLADSESNSYLRVRKLLAEDEPVIQGDTTRSVSRGWANLIATVKRCEAPPPAASIAWTSSVTPCISATQSAFRAVSDSRVMERSGTASATPAPPEEPRPTAS
jgi:hypothetical protein